MMDIILCLYLVLLVKFIFFKILFTGFFSFLQGSIKLH